MRRLLWQVRQAGWLAIASVALMALSSCVEDSEPSGYSLPVGGEMPRFEVELTDGTRVSNVTLRGKPSVIILFNTGCGDCRRELPVVENVYRAMGHDAQFISIARNEGAASILRFWREMSLTLPVSPQGGNSVYKKFADSGIPRIYVFDSRSVVRASFSEALPPDSATLASAISEAAGGVPPGSEI